MQMVRAIESTIKKFFALHYSVIGSKTSAGKASNKYQGEQVNWNLNMYFIAQNDQINKLLHQNGLRGGDQQCSVKYQRIACSFSISNQERWPHTNMHTDLMNQLIQVRDQRWGAYPSCHGTRDKPWTRRHSVRSSKERQTSIHTHVHTYSQFPSIYFLIKFRVARRLEPIPAVTWEQGRVHRGHVASPSQRKNRQADNHTYCHFKTTSYPIVQSLDFREPVQTPHKKVSSQFKLLTFLLCKALHHCAASISNV